MKMSVLIAHSAAAVLLLLQCTPTSGLLGLPSALRQRSSLLFAEPSALTVKYFERVDQVEAAGGAGGSSSLRGLQGLENAWEKLKNGGWQVEPGKVVDASREGVAKGGQAQYDIAVCGGTLGIFYATAMQRLGYRVCVLERGKIAGRPQEWNVSKKEINAMLRMGVLMESDVAAITGIEFNPVRVGFKNEGEGFEVLVRDVLNLGVKPDVLIALVKERFEALGGTVLEGAALGKIDLHSDMAQLHYEGGGGGGGGGEESSVTARLVLDSMGNGSPISKQIRGTVEPDGVCVVVGTCASGYDQGNNTYGDLIYTNTPITQKSESDLQYFWEAFPSGSGPTDRTTYLFTYMDAKPQRPSIMEIMDDYWKMLPGYQGRDWDKDLKIKRVLFGCFPTYRASPLQSPFSRVLQVGDASGIQSPLSFGGFGSLTRHLGRVVGSLQDALEGDLLGASDLRCINAYQPNLSACWMFQRAMSVKVGQRAGGGQVTDTLSNSFSAMKRLGDSDMRPFLQDVIQFFPLARTLLLAGVQDPFTPFKILPAVGLGALLDFFYHFGALAWYTLMSRTRGQALLNRAADLKNALSTRERFQLRRKAEEWRFGSGLDFDEE